MKQSLKFSIMITTLILSFTPISANAKGKSLINTNKKNVALNGHDVVAYFDEGRKKGVKGSKDFSSNYQGTNYYFSSQENLNKFESSPKKYLPAYGGYCAWAVEESSDLVSVNYDTFTIEKDKGGNERLLLFYNSFFINTLSKWKSKSEKTEKGTASLLNKADQNWLKITASKIKQN